MTQAFDEFGDRRNPAILFLHGIRLGRAIWTQHAAQLAQRFHVVTLDLPGHGERADESFTEATIGAALDRTIDEVCGAPPLIVGYSLGGFVAMRYAARRPERTSGLVLAGCTLDFEGWKHWPYEVSCRISELLPGPLFWSLLNAGTHLTLPPAWASLVAGIPFNREVIPSITRMAAHAPNSEKMHAYRKPVQIVNGEYDLVFRIDERRYLQAMPQARLTVLRGVDHTFPMRRSQEFTVIVGDVADRVFATPAP